MDSVNSSAVATSGEPAPQIAYTFECQFCETLFNSLDAYRAHSEVHETQFQYEHSCTECSHRFVCKEELQLHSRLHSDLKPYKCKLCSESFRLARGLEYHLIAHGSKRVFTCSMCDATFLELADIHEHLRDHQMGRVEQKPQLPVVQQQSLDEEVPAAEEEEEEGDGEEDKYLPLVEASYHPERPPNEAEEEATDAVEEEPSEDLHTNAPYSAGATTGVVGIGGGQRRAADGGSAAGAALSHIQLKPAAAATNGVRVGGVAGRVVSNCAIAAAYPEEEEEEPDEEAVFARAVNVKKTFCNLCNKKMATRKSLNTHYKSVHMKNAHTCGVCRTSFLFSRLLEEHTQRRKRIIPCEFCDLRFCSNKRWDSHIAKHRADSVVAGGGAGGGGVRTGMVMYPRAVPLSITMARHSNNSNHSQQQTISLASAKQQSLLKNNHHKAGSSSPSPSPVTTTTNSSSNSVNNRVSANRMSLLASAAAQPTVTLVNLPEGSNTIGKFPCDSCGKIFLSLHYLQSHLVKRRNPNFQFQCDLCEHRFSKKTILDDHKQYHDRMAAKKVAKLIVRQPQPQVAATNGSTRTGSSNGRSGRTTTDTADEEVDFAKHIVRLSDSSFKCNCCERTFKAINHLKCHIRYTHMKKNYKCRSCNQQFPFYKVYLAHMKNSKLCERCDKRICAKFDFKIHMQKCRGTAKMRNSTGNIVVPKSSIVEIKDDDEEEEDLENLDYEDDDAVIIDENGGGGGVTHNTQTLHSSLMLPNMMDASSANPEAFPSIPHFLMDDLMMEPEEYKCEPCGKVFSKMTSLHMHSFQHDPNKEMKCLFCNFLFLQRSSLNRHYRCRNTLHTCQVCKEAFCSHLSLRQHTCGEGTGDNTYVDSSTVGGAVGGAGSMEVDDDYMDVDDLKAQAAAAAASGGAGAGESRKRNRAGNVIGSVARASMGVNSEDVSGRDESIELSDTEPDSLACMLCDLVMNTKAELDHHVATEHGTVTKCTVCFKSFRSPTILHIHMAARASKKNKIECPNCSHRFNKQAEFRKHFMYHTMKQNRPDQSDEAIYSRIASKYNGK